MLEEGLFESAFYSILRHPQSFSQIPLSVVAKESRQFEKEPPEPLESPKYSLFEEIGRFYNLSNHYNNIGLRICFRQNERERKHFFLQK